MPLPYPTLENGNARGDLKKSKLSVVQTLRERGSASRIELVRITGLSRTTISNSVAELMQWSVVEETEKNESARGRPATKLDLTPGRNLVVGAAFDPHGWTLGAFDLAGNVIDSVELAVTSMDADRVLRALVRAVPSFVSRLPRTPIPVIGLGTPGLVDTDEGVVLGAADLGWHNEPISKNISGRLGWPCVIVNRHRARGLAECRYGAARNFEDVVYIGVSTGIAAGIFHDGRLVNGAIGGAGEIGHITINPNGPLCECGNHGCLQSFAAAGALEAEMQKRLRGRKRPGADGASGAKHRPVQAEEICAAADAGDQVARSVVADAADYLGIAMANLVNTFNPQAIVLGGQIPAACRYYVERATETMRRRALQQLSRHTEVTTAAISQIGGALGAATFALDKNLTYFHLVAS